MSAYNLRPVPRPHKHTGRRFIVWPVIFTVLLLGAYTAYALLRPLPALKTTITPPVITGQVTVNVPWPSTGQAAFGAAGYGLLASRNDTKPLPTASVAKTITALAILEKKPLKPGETGPMITLTERDVTLYNEYVAKDGSAVPVYAGEKISEYQALQAMMIPSANNIADSAAIWAFGSLPNYIAFANDFVDRMGMTRTTITDASGFSPNTVSTASDLVRLGSFALKNPVLSEIVSQKSAVFPEYGTIENVNALLGTSGIRGIKTGNTDEAGGCYLAAADVAVAGQTITVITAVMGAPNLAAAMKASVPMIQASVSEFQNVQVVRAGQNVGQVTAPWGATSDIVATKDISVLAWNGSSMAPESSSKTLKAPAAAGTDVGSLSLTTQGKIFTSSLNTQEAIAAPTIWWRLSHPL